VASKYNLEAIRERLRQTVLSEVDPTLLLPIGDVDALAAIYYALREQGVPARYSTTAWKPRSSRT
jgi:hypothetical protein